MVKAVLAAFLELFVWVVFVVVLVDIIGIADVIVVVLLWLVVDVVNVAIVVVPVFLMRGALVIVVLVEALVVVADLFCRLDGSMINFFLKHLPKLSNQKITSFSFGEKHTSEGKIFSLCV